GEGRAGVDVPVIHCRTLAHADQPASAGGRRGARAVRVVDLDDDVAGPPLDGDVDAGRAGRVAQDVGQRLLDDPEDGELQPGVRGQRRPGLGEGGRQPGGLEAGDEVGEVR